jgi:hypothetical protein
MGYPELSFISACRALQRTNNQNPKIQIKTFLRSLPWLEKGEELFKSEIGLWILYILDLSCIGNEPIVEGHR